MPYRIKNEMSSTMLSFRTFEGTKIILEPGQTAVVSRLTDGIESLKARGRLSYVSIEDEICVDPYSHLTDEEMEHELGEPCVPEPMPGDNIPEFSSPRHDRIRVTAQHIIEKKFALSSQVTNNSTVMFLPEGGIPQFPSIDFTTEGNKLSWSGLGLDGFIETDDIVHVYYS